MDSLTKSAITTTLHCLAGCAIGEVLGLVLGTLFGWSTSTTILVAIGLAFFFGYLFTITPILRTGIVIGTAIRITLAADTVSIATMEIIDNAIILAIPGAMDAGLNSLLFWGSLAVALFVAFWVTVPINRYLIQRGLGHAVVHKYHQHTTKDTSTHDNMHHH